MRADTAATRVFRRAFGWAGALLFALSLIYFVYSYLTRFGDPAGAGGRAAPILWNVALFTGFALHHSVCARLPVRRWVERHVHPDLERPIYVWIASLLFVGVCAAWAPVPGVAWRADGLLLWVLRVLQAAGVGLTLWSAGIIGIRTLSGVAPAPASASAAPAPSRRAEGTPFMMRGPYGWLRHPIYAGWFLMVLPASPMTMTRLVFAAVSCAYLVVAIPFEERSLRAASGGAYDEYMARVQWRLIPGVY